MLGLREQGFIFHKILKFDYLCLDTEPSLLLMVRLLNNHFYVPTQYGQQAEEAVDGILPKISSQESRNIGLGQSKQFRCFNLLEPALAYNLVNAGNKFCL